MKSTPQSSDGDKQADPHAPKNPQSLEEAAAPLPHENDQNAESQNDEDPRRVGAASRRIRTSNAVCRIIGSPRRRRISGKRRKTTRTPTIHLRDDRSIRGAGTGKC